jgi:UDP-N-acetylglucosamine 2-epimerase (non-hydrolysing)
MKVATIFGIRPDWIKGCMVLKELDRSIKNHIVVHAGQHYSYRLDRIFFEQLGIRKPDYSLEVGSGTQGEQIAKIIQRSEKVVKKENPDIVLVLGDSNSSVAAIAAVKNNVNVARIEAGMRAYDWRMPEESNKRMIDHITRFLFAYTNYQRDNLLFEGIAPHKIFVTGNPTVDTIQNFKAKAEETKIIEKLHLTKNEYFLATAHRAENVDNKMALAKILKAFKLIYKKYKRKIVLPLYPRTNNRINKFKLKIPYGVEILKPQGFLEFLNLEMNSSCIITDSGTVQEEACILKKPCIVTRLTTERLETIDLGASTLSGIEPENIINSIEMMINKTANWKHPYGNNVANKIVDNIKKIKKENLFDNIRKEIVDKRRINSMSPYMLR